MNATLPTAAPLSPRQPWRWPVLTDAAERDLPPRVLRQLSERRRQNDIIVCVVQALLIAVFALLYAVSPKTFSANAPFAPVPWALGIYAVLTAIRLTLALRGPLAPWAQMSSIVVDVCWLMLTIWSFHVQYGQPPAFYLKAPTLLYVFILVALRVLTMSPVYVIAAGLAAALGWMCMLLYAVKGADMSALVTRDYVTYLTSTRVLYGGEVDKMVSILLVAFVLAVAAYRARRILIEAVTEQAASTQLARFFPPEVVQEIVSSKEGLMTGEGRIVEAATVFIDLRGFTKLAASIPPAELLALISEYQKIAVPIIQARGGTVIAYLGDGILATFGAPRESATQARSALEAVDDMSRAFAEWQCGREKQGLPAPGFGIGVALGPVLCGATGDATRLDYTVIGDSVNRAAKLQNHTKAAKVRALATVDVVLRAEQQGYTSSEARPVLKAAQVAGLAETIDLAVLC